MARRLQPTSGMDTTTMMDAMRARQAAIFARSERRDGYRIPHGFYSLYRFFSTLADVGRAESERRTPRAPAPPRADWRACCADARPLACVCVAAWTCPRHGEGHYGSHD